MKHVCIKYKTSMKPEEELGCISNSILIYSIGAVGLFIMIRL